MIAYLKRMARYNQRMNRRLALLCVLAPVLLCSVSALAAHAPDRVLVQLKWKHQFQFAGYYAALEKGFYRDAGLDVHLLEGELKQPPVERLLEGKADYAVADAGAIIYRAKGEPVVLLASIFQHSPQIILVRANSGVRSPADLKGKRVMLQQGYLTVEVLSMLSHFQVHQFTRQTSSYDIRDLIEGRTDAFPAYSTNEPFLMRQMGVPYRIFYPQDYGMDFYGDTLVTTENELKKHPERAAAFRRASIRGWQYALDHMDEIVELIKQKYDTQHKSRAHLLFEAKALRTLIMPDVIPIGLSNPRRWQYVQNAFVKQGFLSSPVLLKGFLYQEDVPVLRIFLHRYGWYAGLGLLLLIVLALLLYAAQVRRYAGRLEARVQQRTSEMRIHRDRLQAVINNSAAAIGVADNQGHYTLINAAWRHFLAYPAKEICGKTPLDFMHPDDVEDCRAWMQGMLHGKRDSYRSETRFMRKDGEAAWGDFSVTAVRDTQGDLHEMVSVLLDVSERRRVDTQIRNAKDDLQSILDNMQDTYFRTDADGMRMVRVSASAGRLLGYSVEELLGMNIGELFAEFGESDGSLIPQMERAGGAISYLETPLWRKDKKLVWISLNAHCRRSHDGAITGVEGTLRDVSSRIMVERELRLAKETAEAANRDKSRFLAAASHDLRQPLYALNIYLESLGVALSNEKHLQLLTKARQSGDALSGLLNSLLDLSQLDVGIAPTLQSVDMPALLHALAEEWRPQAEAKGLVFRLHACRGPVAVHSDPVLLGRMLRNLLSNAVRHSKRGGILLGCRRLGNHVRIGVWDTGPGIAQQEVGHIFSEFYQLKNPERDRNKGLGLGLAIVRRLSEVLEHRVYVRSVPGRGSCFAVDALMVEPAMHPPVAAPGQHVQSLNMAGRYIIVVDDEANVLDAMGVLLADWGCKALLAEDCDTLVRKLGENGMRRPDAIVADYRLRGGYTGIEAVRHVRELFDHDIPAIIVTADTAVEVARQSNEAACMILHKPAQPARLRALLRHCMESDVS